MSELPKITSDIDKLLERFECLTKEVSSLKPPVISQIRGDLTKGQVPKKTQSKRGKHHIETHFYLVEAMRIWTENLIHNTLLLQTDFVQVIRGDLDIWKFNIECGRIEESLYELKKAKVVADRAYIRTWE